MFDAQMLLLATEAETMQPPLSFIQEEISIIYYNNLSGSCQKTAKEM